MSDRFGNIPIQAPESSPFDTSPSKKTSPLPTRPSKPPRPKGKKKSPKQASFSKTLVLLIALAIIFACYNAMGFFGVPYYFSRILPKYFHEQTTMVLEPTTVTFNPFTFQLKIGDLRILADSGATILTLHALQTDIAPLAVFHRTMAGKTLAIKGLDLNIVREVDGSYNFQPIFGTGKNRKISEIIKSAELPFFFSLNNISIADSKIIFNDKPTGKIHTAEEIELDLPAFSNTSFQTEHYLRPHFSAIVNGSPIELTGKTNLGQAAEEQATSLTVDVQDLELPTYVDYLPFNLPITCSKGTANGKIDLLFDPHNTTSDKLSIGFKLQIVGAELSKADEAISISVPSARVEGSLQPLSRKLQLSEVAIREPTINSFGKSLLENIGENIDLSTPKDEQDSSAAVPTGKAAPYQLTIDLLLVDKGLIQLFSEKKAEQPAATWKIMQVSIQNYHSDAEAKPNEKNGSLRISGEKEGTSTSFSWQGKFSSPDSLTGSLHLLKIDSKDLLKATIGDNHLFTAKDIQGVADLKGQLILYRPKGSKKRIDYKLVDAEVSINDFVLLDKEQSILRAPIVKLTGLSLTDATIDFGTIQLQNGTAQFVYGRLPKIYREFTTSKYRVQGLDFTGKVLFTPEKKSEQSLTFSEVSVKANELDSGQKLVDNISVSAKTEAGGIFKAQGSVTLTPFSVALKTGFRQLPAQDIWSFFTGSSLPVDFRGNLSGKGLFSLPATSFAGELEISDVFGKGPLKAPFSWQKSVLREVNYTAHPLHFGVSSVAIEAAHFSWQITRESNSPMQYFSDIIKNYFPVADKQSSPQTENSTSPVDIDEISFTTSTIDIADRRLSPVWTVEGVSFTGNIKNIHAAASAESRFSFTGQLADGLFTIDGTMAPFAQEENGIFHFSLDNFPLASFTRQLAGKTEIDTGKGRLQLTLDGAWKNRQYISSGKLVLADLKPVVTSPDLALPLALLSDSNGTIDLPFNFSRTEPVAKTDLVEELFITLQRQLLKGSVSPLLLASGDFTDLIGNEFIEFHPGEFMFTDTGQKILSRYAEVLLAHQNVGLVFSGGVDKKIDGLAMKKNLAAVEQLRVDKENESLFKKWQEKKALYRINLEEQHKSAGANDTIIEQDIPAVILTEFKPLRPVPVVITEDMLVELAHKRIDIVSEYFTTQKALQPERMTSVLPDSLTDEPKKPANGVTITLRALNQ